MRLKTFIFILLAGAVLSACGGGYEEPLPIPPKVGDENVKVGTPYKINGVTYYPRIDQNYDEVGNASWYGSDFHGKRTANGEVYDMNQLSAAHKTLPMPSYVRVTNQSNGRSLVLRVNDRGPFVGTRILDVSRAAAQVLGFEEKGVQKVRVQAVQPDGSFYPKIIDGGLTPAPQRTAEQNIEEQNLDFPEPDQGDKTTLIITPGTNGQTPVQNTIQVDEGVGIFVQVASFTQAENAENLGNQLRSIGPIDIQKVMVKNILFYRVRVGAYGIMDNALAVLKKIKNMGFSDAHIFTDPSG